MKKVRCTYPKCRKSFGVPVKAAEDKDFGPPFCSLKCLRLWMKNCKPTITMKENR